MSGAGLRSRVRKGDAAAVASLVTATGFFSDEECSLAAELVVETLERGPASGYQFLFLDGASGLDGYTCFGRIPATRSSFDLYWIAVAPGQQGLGVGRKLIEASEAIARRQGGTAMYVDTAGRPQYASTRAFYERCGYALVATLDDFYAPGDAKIVYSKALGPGR